MRAELKVVAEADGRLGLEVKSVGHDRQDTGHGEVVCVEREDVRCPSRLQAGIPRFGKSSILAVAEHSRPFGGETVDECLRLRGGRAVVHDDHIDRLGLLNRPDRLY